MNDLIPPNILIDCLRHPERPLALLGSVALGSFILLFISGFLLSKFTKKPLPLWAQRIVQLLGGTAGGWLAALLIFGSGGNGIGGPGGPNLGSNLNKPSTVDATNELTNQPKQINKSVILKMQVLTDTSAKSLMKESYSSKKHYLISDKPNELLDIESLYAHMQELSKTPNILERIEIIIGVDDPDRDTNRVRLVRTWAETNKVAVEFLPR